MRKIFDRPLRDIAIVICPNGTMLGMLHLVDVRTYAEIFLVGITIAFTMWRWHLAARNDRRRQAQREEQRERDELEEMD